MGKHSAAEPYLPPRKRGVFTENDRFVSALARWMDATEVRAIDDPSVLPEIAYLVERFGEIIPVAVAKNAARYSQDKRLAPSGGEIARLMGVTPQSISETRKKGDRILFDRQMGQTTIRRRDRIARTLTRKKADAELASWLERKDAEV